MLSNTYITGIGKSGTTALYFLLENNIKYTKCLFHPSEYDILKLKFTTLPGSICLCKETLDDQLRGNYERACDRLSIISNFFPKRILLVRDLRDVIISALLYSPCTRGIDTSIKNSKQVASELIRNKILNPCSVDLCEIVEHDVFRPFRDGMVSLNESDNIIDLYQKSLHVIKYEHLCNNNFQSLYEYLELDITLPSMESVIFKQSEHIIRAKGRTTWRDWFTPKDVEYFSNNSFNSKLEQLGYDSNDWNLNKIKRLDPDITYKYFITLLQDHMQ